MTAELERLRATERWIAWVRLAAVPFAVVEVGLLSTIQQTKTAKKMAKIRAAICMARWP